MDKDVFLWTALSASQELELDELLWTVLWKPLGLARDVRRKFKARGRETVIAAEMDGRIIGGLVAVWDDQGEVEIRHLAVDAAMQGRGRGNAVGGGPAEERQGSRLLPGACHCPEQVGSFLQEAELCHSARHGPAASLV